MKPAAPMVVRELTEKRSETKREFLMSDGRTRAVYYGEPVYYRDSAGDMTEVDPSLRQASVDGKAAAVSRAGRISVKLPDSLVGDWISVGFDGGSVEIRPTSGLGKDSAPLGAMIAARSTGNASRTYPKAFGGADLTYDSTPGGLKESIIIPVPTSATVFSFDLALTGFTPRLEPDGSISLFRNVDAPVTLTIPAPAMWDSAETTSSYSSDVHYELSGAAPTYRLDVVADAGWLESPERTYPVTIDPSVETTCLPRDTYISSGAQTTNYGSATRLYVNNHYSGADWTEYALVQPTTAMATDMAAKYAAGYKVVRAELDMTCAATYGSPSVLGYRCTTANVNLSTVTWASGRPAVTSDRMAAALTPSSDTHSRWDITQMVSLWQSLGNDADDCTVQLQTTATGSRASFTSAQGSGASPIYTIDYSTVPLGTAKVTVDTTSSASWHGDGITEIPNDTNTAGRGSAQLSWDPVGEATSYSIYLHDGNTFRKVGSTTSTSWTSAGKCLYPSDTAIAGMAANYSSNPYMTTGLDLRDDPLPLYAKTAGTMIDGYPAYLFKVVPANAAGEAPVSSQATVTVQMADRTRHAYEAPAYTTYDLGSVAGDDAQVRLNNGVVTLTSTDLAVDSYGPPATVTRTYSSESTAQTSFGDGWRFNFETSITAGPGTSKIYTDGTGQQYRFNGTSPVWTAPHSMVATLTWVPASSTYELAFKGGDKQVFDSTGRLISEKDRHGSATDYIWNGTSSVTIRAANGHSIVVTFSGGAVTKATYQAGSDTRLVTYTARTQVDKKLSSKDTLTVQYGYDAAQHIQSVTVPGFAPGGIAALWRLYLDGTSGALSRIEYPNGTASASRETSVSIDTVNRTAHVYRTARIGLDGADSRIEQVFTWDPTGRQTSAANPAVCGFQPDGVATSDYSAYGTPRCSETASDVITLDVADVRGNVLISQDKSGDRTLSTFNSTDDLLASTDPGGALTLYEYNALGDLTTERRTLNDNESSETSRTYDGFGRVLTESQLLNGSGERQCTEYAYTAFITPTTTIKRGVSRGWLESPISLTCTNSLDAFGQVIAATDDTEVQTESTVYDLSGRIISTTDASGTVTHHAYDVLSAEVETSRTAGTAWADFTRSTIDPTGLVLSQSTYIESGGAPVLSNTTTFAYDAVGNELTKSISDQGSTRTAYDARGNVTYSWGTQASDKSNLGQATKTDYTADSQVKHEEIPGVATGSGVADTTYNDEGLVDTSDAVDAGVSKYDYDANGNRISASLPSDDGERVSETSEYDKGGRVVENGGPADDATTTAGYDLADRQVSSGLEVPGGTARVSATDYNTLGWVLRTIDADGVTTYHTYDRAGREVSSQVVKGTQSYVVTHAFDGLGRDILTVNADGTTVETSYDAFGRQSLRIERASAGSQTKSHDVSFTYDARGRLTDVFDAVPQMRTVTAYATTLTGWTTLSRTLPGSTLQLVLAPNGLEESRTLSAQAGGTGGWITSLGDGQSYRSMAGVQQMWEFTTSSGSTGTRLDVRNPQGKIFEYMVHGLAGEITFDPDSGRKDSETFTAGDLPEQTNTYSYTDSGRLASATVDGVSTQYEYDSAGQIKRAGAMTLGYGTSHLETSTLSSVTTTYTYDDLGRRLSQVSPTNSAYFDWDAHSDRLLTYTHQSGASTDVTATFTYDSSGQRTGSVVTSSGVTTTSRYIYDGLSLVSMECTRAGEATRFDFMYDEAGKLMGLLASAGSPRVTYQLPVRVNDRGDVVSLNGAVSYSYDAYGRPLKKAVSSSSVPAAVAQAISDLQPLRYAGYAYDEFAGLYYCSQRYYDPVTAQFISRDPVLSDAEAGAYQYCSGNPVSATDPSGKWPKQSHWNLSHTCAGNLDILRPGANTVAKGSLETDVFTPSDGTKGITSQWHFDLINSCDRLSKHPYETPAEVWKRYLHFGLRKGNPSQDARYNKFSYCFETALVDWRLGYRESAYYLLGRGIHCLQDSYAHGNIAPGGDHSRYEAANLDPDKTSNDPRRWRGARWITNHWFAEFARRAKAGN